MAGKLDIERERRARERVKEKADDEHQKEFAKQWEPMGHCFKRSYMADSFAEPNLASKIMATQDAESLLRDVKLDPSGTPFRSTGKTPIKLNQG